MKFFCAKKLKIKNLTPTNFTRSKKEVFTLKFEQFFWEKLYVKKLEETEFEKQNFNTRTSLKIFLRKSLLHERKATNNWKKNDQIKKDCTSTPLLSPYI